MKRLTAMLSALLIISSSLAAGQKKQFTFEQIFQGRGDRLINSIPSIRSWADGNQYYETREGKLFKVNARNGRATLFIDPDVYPELKEEKFNLLRARERTADYKTFLFVKEKILYVFKRGEKKLIKVIQAGEMQNPTLSPDGNRIAYTINGDLYTVDISSSKTSRLTSDGSEMILNGYASWVYYEEILGRGSRYRAFWWSPDSSKIVFMRFDQNQVPIFSIYRESGDYGELEKQRYPKPGYANPTVKIGVCDLTDGKTDWIPFSDQNDHYLAFPVWSSKSDTIYFQWLNRDQNQLRIHKYNLADRTISKVYEEKQPAWVDFISGRDLNFLSNGNLIIRSSSNGWFHIYLINSLGEARAITQGNWTVNSINLINEKRKEIYFTARKEDSTESDFYRVDFSGNKITRLTEFKGSHRAVVSTDGKYFIDSYSNINTPTRLEIRNNRGRLVRKLADSYSDKINEYELAKVELFRIKTSDGYQLPALWYLPPNLDKNKKYPVIINIYGGPGSSGVGNRYGGTRNHFYAQHGIIMVSLDHRGSGHFGKKGIDLMHRNLGKWEMHDYIECVKYLESLPFVDGDRIGITGGSYGGYVSALALTYGADYFDYGIAGSSVIDWHLYDSVYTERYMDTPKDNPQGYKSSSVLNYIDRYKGQLRITHGTMDDNVHMQNTIQFIDKLLDSGKTCELMLYPGARHGIGGRKRQEITRSTLNFWFNHFFGRPFDFKDKE